MTGRVPRPSSVSIFAALLTALLLTAGIPCRATETGTPQPPQVVPESTVGYKIDGPRQVISIKPGEELILGSAPRNIGIDLKGKTVVVKDANLNVVSFDSIALRDKVTVWRKDDKVYIRIAPKPSADMPPN